MAQRKLLPLAQLTAELQVDDVAIEERQDTPPVLFLRGEFDICNACRLREILESQAKLYPTVTLDMADTTFIDASVLGVLASTSAMFPDGLFVRRSSAFVARLFAVVDMAHMLSM